MWDAYPQGPVDAEAGRDQRPQAGRDQRPQAGRDHRMPRGGFRCRAKREQLKRVLRLLPEGRGQNLALTVLYVPRSLDSGTHTQVSARRPPEHTRYNLSGG